MIDNCRKAQTISLIALIVSVGVFVGALLFGVFQFVLGVYLFSWLMLACAAVWGILLAEYKHRIAAEQERLDMAELAKRSGQSAIFSSGGDRAALLMTAQKRLAAFQRWALPIFSVVLAAYEIGIGVFLLKYKTLGAVVWTAKNPLLGAVVMAILSFALFLLSRYAAGMSIQTEWKPLRAGGSYLLAAATLGFAMSAALAAAQFKYGILARILEYALPILLMLLGAEILFNWIFDFYRPRAEGVYSRAAFDSRLLGLFSEPGGLLHTIAHTLDYQFGFQVSQTWFYKLLGKTILPLILFAALTLYVFSSVVIVQSGYGAIIERFGSPEPERGGRTVGAGLWFKWPWPVEIAYIYPTERISQIGIGYRADEKTDLKKPLLWGQEHFAEEYNLLVATETTQQKDEGVPVSIIRANMPVQYRIRDLYAYLYHHYQPEKLIEAICYRELARLAASAKVEVDDLSSEQGAREAIELLGADRAQAAELLRQRIQQAADQAGLGIEVVFLGLQGIHPPPQVVPDYQEVIGSVQSQQAAALNAQAERHKILAELAGSEEAVETLYQQALAFSAARQAGDNQTADAQRAQLLEGIVSAGGKVFSAVRSAQADAFEKAAAAKGEGLRFDGQLKAYQAAPALFSQWMRLSALEEGLGAARKYVVAADQQDSQVYMVDLQEKLTPSLYDLDLGLEQKK